MNSVEVRTVRPSIYKHLITGLSANTLYRVSVRAKPGKLLCTDEKNPKKLEMLTTFVDFRTLPKSMRFTAQSSGWLMSIIAQVFQTLL